MRVLEALGWGVVHSLWLGVLLQLAWRRIDVPVRDAHLRYRIAVLLLCTFVSFFGVVVLLFAGAKTGRVPVAVVPQVVPPQLSSAALEYHGMLPATPLPPLLRMVGVLWVAGVLLCLGRLMGGWQLATRAYLRRARVARPEWQELVDDVGRSMGVQVPAVVESSAIGSPAIVGFVRPVLVLPAERLPLLAPVELRAVFAHELAHVRRRDSISNLLLCIGEALCFFHPAVWRLGAAVRIEREKICDLAACRVARDPRTYVRGLLKLEELRVPGAHAIGAVSGASLVARTRYLLEQRTERAALRLAAVTLALLLAVGICGAAALPPALRTAARSAGPDLVRIDAADPAGAFTVTFRYGQVTGATIDGVSVPRARLSQRGDSLIFLDARMQRAFAVRVRPAGGISWTPRSALHP